MTIWSWGANSYGQLGHLHKDDQLVPVSLPKVPGAVKQIACGGGHTLYLTDQGQLFSCGSNNKGQLGIGNTDDVSSFTPVTGVQTPISMVAAGWDFSFAVTETGDVYSWGSNAFGQLGDPNLPAKCLQPKLISSPKNVIKMVAGLRHGAALTSSGEVFCWGHAKRGQCGVLPPGTPVPLKYLVPQKVDVKSEFGRTVDIVAGSYHTAAVTDKGAVVIWGCNKHGQTTQDPTISSQINLPFQLEPSVFKHGKITRIRSGWTHLLAQSDCGSVYSWGRHDYGQLGRSVKPGQGHIPAVLETGEKLVSFECGSEHCLFLTESGKLWSVGWNEHGLCGTGDEENVEQITPVQTLKDFTVTYLACGGGHCFVITADSMEYG